MGWDELEGQARELVEECGTDESPWNVYDGLKLFGIRIVEASLPPGERAFYVPDSKLIVIRRGLKPCARLMALLHEFSHAISTRRATHADVHALSLCLAITPQRIDAVLEHATEVTAQDLYDRSIPQWTAVLRARYHHKEE